MLLRDSQVAKQIRSYLLNVEEIDPVEQRLTAVTMLAKTPNELTQVELFRMAESWMRMAAKAAN